MNLLAHFRSRLTALGASNKEKYLVAVSGGLDSVTLLHLCVMARLDVTAAHVNYGLRGAESDGDEEFVKNLCKELNVPCHVERHSLDKKNARDGVQAEARNIRYAWFASLKDAYSFDWVLTAHHLDDRLESLLMNMARGAGLKGLRSIPDKNGTTLRPLLDVSRERIAQFALAENIAWRNDSSNEGDAYLRNRIRHGLATKFNELLPHALVNVGKSMDYLAEADAFLQKSALDFVDAKMVEVAEGEMKLGIHEAELLFVYPALGKYVLDLLGFDPAQLPALRALGDAQTGKKLIGSHHTVYRDRDFFNFSSLPLSPTSVASLSTNEGAIAEPIALSWCRLQQDGNVAMSANKDEAFLDGAVATLPFALRRWQEGDRFQPLGMRGSRKVSDFLTDLKLSPVEKGRTLVLLSQGEICWVVGQRISERFKVRPESKVVWHFKRSHQQMEQTIVTDANER